MLGRQLPCGLCQAAVLGGVTLCQPKPRLCLSLLCAGRDSTNPQGRMWSHGLCRVCAMLAVIRAGPLWHGSATNATKSPWVVERLRSCTWCVLQELCALVAKCRMAKC